MNSKKGLLKMLVMLVAFVAVISIATASNATPSSGKILNLKNPTYRASGYAYQAGLVSTSTTKEQHMWKIYEYNTSGGSAKNLNNAIYCLKMGVGFGSVSGSPTQEKTYDTYADMKNPTVTAVSDDRVIINNYIATLPGATTAEKQQQYNSLVWILDHCYVPAPFNSPTQEQIDAAQESRQELLTNAGIPNSQINDDLIDIIQQIAIWYFTNNDQYKAEDISSIDAMLAGGNYDAIEDVFDNWDLVENDANPEAKGDIYMLYDYFINGGKANKNTAPSTTGTNPIRLVSSSSKAILTNNNYIVGPFKIEELSNIEYTLQGSLKAENGTDISYSLLDSNKQATTRTLKELVGEEFYLNVASTANIEKAKFKVSSTILQNTITFWTIANSNSEQPVAELVKAPKTFEEEVTISLSEFDLALRKFITNINGTELVETNGKYTREPNIDLSPLVDKTGTTANYKHPKNPISVEIGDIVVYTLRIYNEGSVSGYATEVTDYLPKELQFIEDDEEINNAYGWTIDSTGRIAKTTKLSKANGTSNLINAFDGTNLDYKELKIKCKVISTENLNNVITNIAEVTEFTDGTGATITDRDSSAANIDLPADADLPDYKGKNNKADLTDKNYFYKGQEDDDDFEKLVLKEFDLALRKFITNINGEELVGTNGKYIREPNIDLTPLVDKTSTTANYKHQKDPIGVSVGDIVIYTLRIYNEGDVSGYASSVTDYLPPQLEFVMDDEESFNATYGWQIDSSLRKATTTKLARTTIDPEDNLIKAFDGTTLDYKELKIKCRVISTEDLDKVITNIAEITAFTDANGANITDRDSHGANVVLPNDENLPDYKGNSSNKSILNDKNYFYKGQEDDDDFEKLVLKKFDLALRKFITGVNDTKVTNRIPVFTRVKDVNGNYIYEHTKEPIEVDSADIVEYTIRIFNEGDIAGYAKEVKDNIPDGLEFLPNNELNIEYRWKMLDENNEETDNVSRAKYIVTDYLSKEQEANLGDNLISEFDTSRTSPDYRDVKVQFKVVAPNSYEGIITNTAEISDDSDENGNEIKDIDSTPNNNLKTEDDIDVEHIKLSYFDLALRKFITEVKDLNKNTSSTYSDRVPVFSIDDEGNYIYTHSKTPVDVENGNIVVYTLRIFNEGTKAGYAKEVKDDLPEGLEFLPDYALNKEYRWVMLDENDEETEDVSKAKNIITDYLSKEQEDVTGRDNLLLAFDPDTMESPNYRDVKIAFKVTEPNTSDRILINKAQISDDSDKDGKDIIDKDSTPNKWIEGEDDQDIEKVKVKYFDLALRKWVTEAIVIENGKETITETGHKAEDDPEEVVKVELKESNYNKVVVKFLYKIRITNEGQIAGYCTEISDYIPEGLKFVAADNPEWKEVDGKIVTDQLKDTLLQPGDTAEVDVLLTWINGKDNFGLKINTAEISKDKNDSDTPDIDSTPNNLKKGEDDIDDAPVILTVKTGSDFNAQIIIIAAVGLVIVTTGVILIKKYVL